MSNLLDHNASNDRITALTTLLRLDPMGQVKAKVMIEAYLQSYSKCLEPAIENSPLFRIVRPPEPTKKRKPAG